MQTVFVKGNPHIYEDSRAIMANFSHCFDVIIPNNETGETVSKIAELVEQLLQRPQWVPSNWL